MTTPINTDQKFAAAVLVIKDSQGRDAHVDGVPAWASSDEAVLKVTPAADGMTAEIDPVGVGTAHVTVTADADLGPGVATITGVSDDVVVTLGPSHTATQLSVNLGAPS